MRLRVTFLLIIFSILFLSACVKDNAKKYKPDNSVHGLQVLPGVWELRYRNSGSTGMAGGDQTAPGNGDIKYFTDSTYHFSLKGKTWDSGFYQLTTGINPATNTSMNAMLLNNDILLPRYFTIANDTLTIYTGIIPADGAIEKYIRITNH